MVMTKRPARKGGISKDDAAAPVMAAAEFKATCLELMDRVRETGVEYVVTKHGRPVARLVPYDGSARPPLFGGAEGHGVEVRSPVRSGRRGLRRRSGVSVLLLDTHVWIWLLDGDTRRIGPRTRRLLDKAHARAGLRVSPVSVFEVSALAHIGTSGACPDRSSSGSTRRLTARGSGSHRFRARWRSMPA